MEPKPYSRSSKTRRTASVPAEEAGLDTLVSSIEAEPAEALSALCARAKKQAARDEIDRLLSDRTSLYAQLNSPLPKARKNAARLLGALAQTRDAAALLAALSREETLFVVPSLLLALGAVGGEDAQAALLAYAAPEPRDVSDEPHLADIRAARDKALSALSAGEPLPPRRDLTAPRDVLLVAPAGFSGVLARELASLGIRAAQVDEGAIVSAARLAPLMKARCAFEVLLPAARDLPLEPARIASAADGVLTRPFRVELRNYAGDRAALIRAIASALGGGDDPSRYADELRVVCHGGRCDVFVKPCNVPDTRFSYRLRALPASIHPATAACLARYALSFVSTKRPRTLDPFCGSGTLLFELERASNPAALLGVDISGAALDAARENALAAKSGARFLRKDILAFEPGEPFDLILSNMPFGNRVGTHASNEPLYRGFVRLLPRLLRPGGVAALYTMEHRLLASCLAAEPALTVAAETRTEAGGLSPRVTLLFSSFS